MEKVAFSIASKDGQDKQAFTLWGIICNSSLVLAPHFPRTLPAAFTECFCSRRRFNSHFHSMRIPSPVKTVKPRGCAGCSVCPLLGLGLAQGKRRRKRRKKGGGGKEKREEGEEGRSGRRLTILARRNTSTPPCWGSGGVLWAHSLCPYQGTELCPYLPHSLQLLSLGSPSVYCPRKRNHLLHPPRAQVPKWPGHPGKY